MPIGRCRRNSGQAPRFFADRYAYAGAIDFFGPAFGLPRVISPNNSYYLWGVRGYSGDSMLAVGATDYPLLMRSSWKRRSSRGLSKQKLSLDPRGSVADLSMHPAAGALGSDVSPHSSTTVFDAYAGPRV